MKKAFILIFVLFNLTFLPAQGGHGGNNDKGSDSADNKKNKEQNNDMNKFQDTSKRDNKNIEDKLIDRNRNEKEIYYEKINSCIVISDEILKKLNNINKEIKMKDKKPKDFLENYKFIIKKNNDLEIINKDWAENLNEEDKKLIKEQLEQIIIIEKEIKERIKIIEKNINDNAEEKDLYSNTKKLEDNINKLIRQYQAILWLLENEK